MCWLCPQRQEAEAQETCLVEASIHAKINETHVSVDVVCSVVYTYHLIYLDLLTCMPVKIVCFEWLIKVQGYCPAVIKVNSHETVRQALHSHSHRP